MFKSKMIQTAALCIAVVAILAAPAAANVSTSQEAPFVTIGPAPAPAPQQSDAGAQLIQPNNVDTAICLTPPGVACYVDYLQSKGISTATFYFSDGTSARKAYSCHLATCSIQAIGFPDSPTREAVTAYVSGPNVTIYASGPYFG